MQVGKRGLDLITKWEGCEKKLKDGRYIAYLDTLPSPGLWSEGYNGLWTIGVGSTGEDVTEGTIWTYAQCQDRLRTHASQKAREVSAYLTRPVNQNQFDALVSLAYNIGTGGIHDILNLVNAGKFEQAAASFVNYNHAGGKVVKGLTSRRLDEQELFEWETPKEVVKLSKPLQQAQVAQAGLGIGSFSIAGLWNYLPQVKEFMADHNGMILLGAVGVTFGITYLWQWHMQNEFNKGTYIPEGTTPEPDRTEVVNVDAAE